MALLVPCVFADDVVSDLSSVSPSGRLFVSFDSTNDFTRYNPVGTLQAGYTFYNSYNVTVTGGLIYQSAIFLNLAYSSPLEFEKGFIYKLEFDVDFRAGSASDYIPNNLTLGFPYMQNINGSSTYNRSTLLNSVYVRYKPVSVVLNPNGNSYHVIYKVRFEPRVYAQFISSDSDVYYIPQLAFIDDSGDLDPAWVDQTIAMQLRVYTGFNASATKMTETEALLEAIDTQTEVLSQEIKNGTAVLSQQLEDIYTGDNLPPMDISEIEDHVQQEFDIFDDLSSRAYVSTSGAFDWERVAYLRPAMQGVSRWFQFTFENNIYIYIVVSVIFSFLLLYGVLRILF